MITEAQWKKVGRGEIVEHARRIAGGLVERGLVPTLRQLYYRFVATGLCPNGQKSYKRIGAVLTDARMTGEFPIAWINDRTRSPEPTRAYAWTDVDAAQGRIVNETVQGPERHLAMNIWYRQPTLVSVWVEKEALAGVFEGPCRDKGVGLFVCRGYPSVSALADWMAQQDEIIWKTGRVCETIQILYFGDHDPDGLQIPESCLASMQKMASRRVVELKCLFRSTDVELSRVALTLDQIEEVNAPPFPAKVTSSRYAGYVESTGLDEAWELDALPPDHLDMLIRSEVDRWFDDAVFEDGSDRVDAARTELVQRLTDGTYQAALTEALGVAYKS